MGDKLVATRGAKRSRPRFRLVIALLLAMPAILIFVAMEKADCSASGLIWMGRGGVRGWTLWSKGFGETAFGTMGWQKRDAFQDAVQNQQVVLLLEVDRALDAVFERRDRRIEEMDPRDFLPKPQLDLSYPIYYTDPPPFVLPPAPKVPSLDEMMLQLRRSPGRGEAQKYLSEHWNAFSALEEQELHGRVLISRRHLTMVAVTLLIGSLAALVIRAPRRRGPRGFAVDSSPSEK